MIIINVLPPEYRRRDIGINPITLTIAGAVIVNLVVLSLWAYIYVLSIPNAVEVRDQKLLERNQAEAKAKEVDKVVAEIAKQKGVQDTLIALLDKKVYWAETLNDFVNVLVDPNNSLNNGKFQVSIDSLDISEEKAGGGRSRRGSAPAVEGRTFDFVWKLQVISETDQMRDFNNINTLFQVFEASPFWGNELGNRFKDQPEKGWSGNSVVYEEKVNRSVAKFGLKWSRYIPNRSALEKADAAKSKKGAVK